MTPTTDSVPLEGLNDPPHTAGTVGYDSPSPDMRYINHTFPSHNPEDDQAFLDNDPATAHETWPASSVRAVQNFLPTYNTEIIAADPVALSGQEDSVHDHIADTSNANYSDGNGHPSATSLEPPITATGQDHNRFDNDADRVPPATLQWLSEQLIDRVQNPQTDEGTIMFYRISHAPSLSHEDRAILVNDIIQMVKDRVEQPRLASVVSSPVHVDATLQSLLAAYGLVGPNQDDYFNSGLASPQFLVDPLEHDRSPPVVSVPDPYAPMPWTDQELSFAGSLSPDPTARSFFPASDMSALPSWV